MNYGRIIVAAVVATIVDAIYGFLVYGMAFHELFAAYPGVYRAANETKYMPVLFGGPVETGRGFVLHSGDFESPESTLVIAQNISLTATVDILRAIGQGAGPRKALFALGYAGWGPGQIENEIRANGWLHCDADAGIVFEEDWEAKWRNALRKLGIDASSLTAQAGRA